MIQRASVVLPVDAIEPSLPFWEALGFEVTARVPHGERLGFVILTAGTAEVMLQSRASLADDLGDLTFPAPVVVFVVVTDLDAVVAAVPIPHIVFAERTTFYGMREIGLRSPGGHLVTLAQPL